jgi:hypothetical protein
MYSKDSYRALLSLALEKGYRFIGFEDERPADASRLIYLRHDVDLFPQMAQEIAQINHSLGIQATFFIQLSGKFYNLFYTEVLENVRAILDLGQNVGLHYPTPKIIPDNPAILTDMILEDFEVFRRKIPEIRPVFSWHNTTSEIIEWGMQHEVPGLVNAYTRPFMHEITYRSDSLARHSVSQFEGIINEDHPVLQLLFHPEIWVGGGTKLAEISAHLWRHIIRSYDADPTGRDEKLAKLLPHRVPDAILDALVRQLIAHNY